MKLRVEYGEGIRPEDLLALEKELVAKMHGDVKVRPAISWLKPNTLERATKKTQLVEKNYERK